MPFPKNPKVGDKIERCCGVVKRILFTSDGYHCFKFHPEGHFETVTATGEFLSLNTDEELTVTGEFVNHKKYGLQLKVLMFERPMPTGKEQVIAYLGSGVIKGVGPARAKLIVNVLGDNALDVIVQEGPEVFQRVKGIGQEQAKKIYDSVMENFEFQNIMVQLIPMGFTPKMALRVFKRFGGNSVDIVRTKPYKLTEVDLIGFKKADEIARLNGLPYDSPDRIRAGIKFVINEAVSSSGHCYLTMPEIYELAAKGLNVEDDGFYVTSETIGQETEHLATFANERGYTDLVTNEQGHYYPSWVWNAEQTIARRVKALLGYRFDVPEDMDDLIDKWEEKNGIKLAGQQRMAVQEFFRHGMLILTGGPGTGKTTVTKAIADIYEMELIRQEKGSSHKVGPLTHQARKRANYVLCAPTGRASRRLSEATGRDASTIHRLLCINPETTQPEFNEENPLSADALFADEFSMVDVMLGKWLFSAIAPGTKMLIVGDTDQLPSVGPGSVLNDLILSSVPAVRLTEIHRQAQDSQIVTNAHAINHGQIPKIDPTKSDFYFIHRDKPEDIAIAICDSYEKLINYGYDIMDVQVLIPMKKGPAGTQKLNEMLQERLNPANGMKREWKHGFRTFREGDKVMQIKNNYKKDVFNGDMGIITFAGVIDRDEERQGIRVRFFDGSTHEYDNDDIDQIQHAFAVTVHKSQGSEFPVVIMPVTTSHYVMLLRNLMYTGVTRAKKIAVMVGTEKAMGIAVGNNTALKRNTGLVGLLKG